MKVACVQANVQFGDPLTNAERVVRELERLSTEHNVELALFPEAFLTGYCVDDATAASTIALDRNSGIFDELAQACEEYNLLAIVGFAETDGANLYNTAVLLEPGEGPRFYRKTHLPELGLDNYVSAGSELPVFETRLGSIGILICFDLRAPEAMRSLTLKGAELVALPTNWPEGAEVSADYIAIARAAENRVVVATCNRVGTENGFTFIGRSKIIDAGGTVLASAGDGEGTIIAEVELATARNKRTVIIPGKYETTVFDSRRPELYGPITEPM